MSLPTSILLKFRIYFKNKSSYQWLLSNCAWIYKEQSLKYVEKPRWLPNKPQISSWAKTDFCNGERSIVPYLNALHQPYINPIHQSIQLRLFSKFKIVCIVKPDNETHDQLTYTCSVSAKPINYLRN